MADLKRIVPPSDYSSADFLSSDYQTTADESITITEQIGYVKINNLVKAVTESVQISESTSKAQSLVRADSADSVQILEQAIAARQLSRNSNDSVQISETVSAKLAAEQKKIAPTDQITIGEQVNYVLGVAPAEPEMSTGMLLSPQARRRLPKARPRYALKPEEPEIPPLLTKVTASCKFRYSIASAKATVEHDAIADQLSNLQLAREQEQQKQKTIPIAKLVAEEERQERGGIAPRGDIGDIGVTDAGAAAVLQDNLTATAAVPTSKVKVLTGIKMRYGIKNEVFSHLSARYHIKDKDSYAKAKLYEKLLDAAMSIDILDSISI